MPPAHAAYPRLATLYHLLQISAARWIIFSAQDCFRHGYIKSHPRIERLRFLQEIPIVVFIGDVFAIFVHVIDNRRST